MAASSPQPVNVHGYDNQYPVRRHSDVYRYRVTAPLKLFEAADINQGEDLGVRLAVDDDAKVTIVYTTNTSDAQMTVAASGHDSTGELTIPSGLGAALELAQEEIEWAHYEFDGWDELHAQTNVRLQDYNNSLADPIKTRPLEHNSQEITKNGESWVQEFFRMYLSREDTDALGWVDGMDICVNVGRVDGTPALILKTDTRNCNEKMQKTVKNSGGKHDAEVNKNDAVLYLPNDVIRALGLADIDLVWEQLGDSLVLRPYEG